MTEIDFQYNFEEEYTANVTETVLKTKYSFPQAKKKKRKKEKEKARSKTQVEEKKELICQRDKIKLTKWEKIYFLIS